MFDGLVAKGKLQDEQKRRALKYEEVILMQTKWQNMKDSGINS